MRSGANANAIANCECECDWARVFEHLGFIWSLDELTMELPESKRAKFVAKLEVFAAVDARVTQVEVESLAGSLVHVALVVPEGRPMLRAIFGFMSSYTGDYEARIPSAPALEEARWWLGRLTLGEPVRGSFRAPPPESPLALFSDASDVGIGIIVGGHAAAFELKTGWKKRRGLDIQVAEAFGVELAVGVAKQMGVSDATLVPFCDNTAVVGGHEAGRSRNRRVNESIIRLLHDHNSTNLVLRLEYLKGADNPADPISRFEAVSGLSEVPFEIDIPNGIADVVAKRVPVKLIANRWRR